MQYIFHSFPSYPQPSRRGSRHLRHQQANSSKLPIAGWLGSTFGANPRLSEWLRSVSHVLWNRGNGRYRGIPDEGWDEFMSVTPINNNGRKYGREINKGMWIKQECMSSWIKRKKKIMGMDGWRDGWRGGEGRSFLSFVSVNMEIYQQTLQSQLCRMHRKHSVYSLYVQVHLNKLECHGKTNSMHTDWSSLSLWFF